MKTISIGTQASAAALANAFAAALAAEIGWTAEKDADGNFTGNVKKDGISVYFKFYVSSSSVSATVSNGYKDATTSLTVAFSATGTYSLHVLKSGGSIAVGTGKSTDAPRLGEIIAQNTAGEYVGIVTASSNIYTLRGIESETRNIVLSSNAAAGVSTSIVKMPDIWGAAMFNNVYYVMSCPFNGVDRVFYIGGKNYRSIGSSVTTMYFAMPEE